MSFKKPDPSELKKILSPQQYICTQEGGTERPFQNEFWDKKDDGIYVDVVSGEPLFSSLDKFDSRSGWPSFTQALDKQALTEKSDFEIGVERTEIRSRLADSHLGHVFDDGPAPTGLRFCINSAALRFVPVDEMKAKGYGRFLFPFAAQKNGVLPRWLAVVFGVLRICCKKYLGSLKLRWVIPEGKHQMPSIPK